MTCSSGWFLLFIFVLPISDFLVSGDHFPLLNESVSKNDSF